MSTHAPFLTLRFAAIALSMLVGSLICFVPRANSADIINQASAVYRDTNSVDQTLRSNDVLVTSSSTRTTAPPTIAFFRDAAYLSSASMVGFNQPIFLQVIATACDSDVSALNTIQVNVTSHASGDSVTLMAHETTTNSGIFQVTDLLWMDDIAAPGGQAGNQLFAVGSDDQLIASFTGCGTGSASAQLLIDPNGIVFDSKTNAPVPGAHVRLIDVTGAGNGNRPGEDALVFAFDGVTPWSATLSTDSNGQFVFPLVAPSRYRLSITPPGDYAFPSKVAPSELPSGRAIQIAGSYGQDFDVNAATGTVIVDVPLDAGPAGLFIQKTASQPTIEIAESLEYTIVVKNVSGISLANITVQDDLPAGFTYRLGTTRIDGAHALDPQGGKGPRLLFAIPALADGESHSLKYRAAVGHGAMQGDGVNRALARSALPAIKESNVATARVRVEGGVFDDKGYVLGKIFADCNSNNVQDTGEPGIPRVRLYMENGNFAVSDGQGKYSFYGVSPRTHTLKVDATSLPDTAKLRAISHRNAGDSTSLFVDVRRGELHRADFAVDNCAIDLKRAIGARQLALNGAPTELTRSANAELKPLDTIDANTDLRALLASGLVGEESRAPSALLRPTSTKDIEVNGASLAQIAAGLDSTLGFIDLNEGDIVSSNQLSVRIKGRSQSTFTLRVNGSLIEESRVGSRVVDERNHVELLEFIGVDLKAGDNELTLSAVDSIARSRTTLQIHVRAPGELARILIGVPTEKVQADSDGVAHVHVRLEDAHGLPVRPRTALTLETTTGVWQIPDSNVNEPGVQIFVENAEIQIPLRAPAVAGDALIRVTHDQLEAHAKIAFVPTLRPMIATGIVEGEVRLRNFNLRSLQPARGTDGFERELNQFSHNSATAGGRAALFLKGKIKGDYLLTLGYDSDKDTNERLFRDIEPDKFYPVYGDSSTKGFDAQSTGRLYVRIDKNKSFALLGDFTTHAINPQSRMLGAYNRSLNGIKQHFEQDRLAVDAFASHDTSKQIVDEVSANGTSGPYFLKTVNALVNSERVEIITRDRNQSSVIINSVLLQRFTDYEIEPFTGNLTLRAPVPSLDASLNTNMIRVTYEVDQGGDPFWVGGIDTQMKVTEHIAFGAAIIQDNNPKDGAQIASANATIKLGSATTALIEVARSELDSIGAGWARRVDVKYGGTRLLVRGFAGYAEPHFENPSATLNRGRNESGVKFSYAISQRTRLVGDAIRSGDLTTDAIREGALLGFERSFEGNVKLEVGTRRVLDQRVGSTLVSADYTSARTKLTAPIPGLTAAAAYGEYEQDIAVSDKRMAALGGEYALANRVRLYLRHEFITSLGGVYSLDSAQRQNTTVVGIDTRYLHDDRVFTEYRAGDSFGGRDAQAAIGLRNQWNVMEGVKLNTSLERVQTISGTDQNENAAITGAIEYFRNPLWKGTARIELRDSDTTQNYFSTFGIARKLSEEWTLLCKNVFSIVNSKDAAPNKMLERLQLGIAYRDNDTNRWNGLARYEFKHEVDTSTVGLRRNVHILSGHVDYQPYGALTLNGQYAGKLVAESTLDVNASATAHLVGARATHDIGSRWDAGLAMRVLLGNGTSTRHSAIGFEAGYLFAQNLWGSLGYNVTGFYDRDLSPEEYTQRGVYLRLRFKFDENLFGKASRQ